jgi:hypothetical protein
MLRSPERHLTFYFLPVAWQKLAQFRFSKGAQYCCFYFPLKKVFTMRADKATDDTPQRFC